MKYSFIKYILLFYSLFITINFALAGDNNKTGTNKICENYISISGSSNINRFTLENKHLEFNRIEILQLVNNQSLSTDSNAIKIPVNAFSCKNKIMLNDFQKLLKSSEYPNINVAIAKNKPAMYEIGSTTNFTIFISLAGVTQKYTVNCKVNNCGNSEWLLKGEKQINLSDFNITPPEKVFGAVKVKDEVFINFAFKFSVEEV